MLISSAELAGRLGDGSTLVLDCGPDGSFEIGHIPGARSIDVYSFFLTDTTDAGLRAFLEKMVQLVRHAGVGGDESVVVYEETSGTRSARAYWLLRFLGHPNVRLLDGGLADWRREGGEIRSGVSSIRDVGSFSAEPDHGTLATAEYLRDRLESPDLVVVDVRDASEHTGEFGDSCCDRAGRIPGSTWIYWENLLTSTGMFREGAEIRAEFESHGIGAGPEIVTYCHRGARAANTFMALRLAGYPNVRNYVGSWHDWSQRLDYPIETGVPW